MASDSSLGHKWRKVAYGGMQPGYDDNYTDDSFLEEMVMNANVVKRELFKVMLDSVSITQYFCIVALVVHVWIQTLGLIIDETTLLSVDAGLLGLGFFLLLLTTTRLSLQVLFRYLLNISFFISGLYILAPVYQPLTRSISSDSITALTVSLLVIHLFFHDYSGSTIRPPRILNKQTLAGFLFAPLVTLCIKNYCFKMHLWFSFGLVCLTLSIVYQLHLMLFILFLALLVFVSVVCPYWLIRIQEYKFEINGPWDEAKLCFDITE